MKRCLAILLVLVTGCGSRQPKYLKEYEALAAKQPGLLAEAKKLGIPVELEDLKGRPTVPREQNAAYDYLSIDKAYLNIDSMSPLVALVDPRTKRNIKGAEWQLYTLTPLLKIVDKAASKPYCQFEHDWSNGISVLLPETSLLRSIAKLYSYRAVYQAVEGDNSGFRSSIDRILTIANCLAESPGIMPLLVQVSIRSIALNAIRLAIVEGVDPLALTQGLKEIIARRLKPIDYRWHLLSEGTIGRMTIRKFMKPMKDEKELEKTLWELSKLELTPASSEGLKKSVGIPLETAQKANDARFLQFIIEAKKALEADPPMDATKFLERSFNTMLGQGEVCTYVLEAVYSSNWSAPVYSEIRLQSAQAVTLGLLEAFDYRREHGAFPAKITQIDPFDGKPLDYQKTANGFKIASRFGQIRTKYGLYPKEPETESQKRLLHFEYKNRL